MGGFRITFHCINSVVIFHGSQIWKCVCVGMCVCDNLRHKDIKTFKTNRLGFNSHTQTLCFYDSYLIYMCCGVSPVDCEYACLVIHSTLPQIQRVVWWIPSGLQHCQCQVDSQQCCRRLPGCGLHCQHKAVSLPYMLYF